MIFYIFPHQQQFILVHYFSEAAHIFGQRILRQFSHYPQVHFKSINKLTLQLVEGNILFPVEFVDYNLQQFIAVPITGKSGFLIFLAD